MRVTTSTSTVAQMGSNALANALGRFPLGRCASAIEPFLYILNHVPGFPLLEVGTMTLRTLYKDLVTTASVLSGG